MKTENLGSRVANLCKEGLVEKSLFKEILLDRVNEYRAEYVAQNGYCIDIRSQREQDDYVIDKVLSRYGNQKL